MCLVPQAHVIGDAVAATAPERERDGHLLTDDVDLTSFAVGRRARSGFHALLPIGGKAMNGKVQPQPNEADWACLLDAERKLEAQIAAAQADAKRRVAQASVAAAAAAPDPAALAALADAQAQADIEQQRSELARLTEQADTRVQALQQTSPAQIDVLAQLALGAVLADKLQADRP